jgi:hypothetical protein
MHINEKPIVDLWRRVVDSSRATKRLVVVWTAIAVLSYLFLYPPNWSGRARYVRDGPPLPPAAAVVLVLLVSAGILYTLKDDRR